MIRVTDRTLSCLDAAPAKAPALRRFLELLVRTGPDAIELSEGMWGLLGPLPDYPGYVLRIERAEDAARYPRTPRFVCRDAPVGADPKITGEILLGDMGEAPAAAPRRAFGRVRLQGLGGAMTGDYLGIFARLRERFRGPIEFCPTDRRGFATALAAEWLINGGGSEAVASFGGVGGFAPTEEVIMVLKLAGLRDAGRTYGFFPEMASLLQEVTGDPVPPGKPVLGKRIFHVESGIHVDGVLKRPECYEPFPPETAGLERKILLGGQSGAASVRAKLEELGIKHRAADIPAILEGVKKKSGEKKGALTNREFAEIAGACAT
ncbi:MAG: hypothetical protein LBG71_07410 [Clostridiales Family XIII bacterium]|nr:hypothetical protein [Clostridiales Family XIII bacterium]